MINLLIIIELFILFFLFCLYNYDELDMKFVFSAKNFKSGLDIRFSIYNLRGRLLCQKRGIEIGHIGIYYVDFKPYKRKLRRFRDCICLVEEINGIWKDFKYIPRFTWI